MTAYNKDNDLKYDLQSVEVHRGEKLTAGHHFCYIYLDEKWYKFNDKAVSVATEENVYVHSWGGKYFPSLTNQKGDSTATNLMLYKKRK